MFFKNLMPYRITQALEIDPQALEIALANKPAREPGSQEMTTYGFVAPFGKGEDSPLVHDSFGYQLIATRKVERILPGSVIQDELKARIERIENDQMRKVYKKERDQIKDEIIQAFLPRAFLRRKTTFAALDLASGLIYVNTSSASQAEDLLSTLREVLGSLPVRPVTVKIAPTATLTDWLKRQQAAPDFHVLDQTVLRDTHEDGGSATLKNQDLTSEETQMHLSTGKVATTLALAWQDKLSFVMDDKFVVKRLKFEDLLHDQAEDDGGDDAAGQFDASFVLMMATFREFFPVLVEAFGGEEIPQGIGADVPAQATPRREVRDEVQVDAFSGEEDALYVDAVKFVRESGRASVSAVQRKFKIGYNRAARLIEAMEMAGVVTPMNTNGSREVVACLQS